MSTFAPEAQAHMQITISPVDQKPVVRRPLSTAAEVTVALERAKIAFSTYRTLSLDERINIAERFLHYLAQNKGSMCKDLSAQMGRPISHCEVEVNGTIARGKHMISLARTCLADVDNKDTDTADHIRYIKREPVGTVFVISPWNYPWFCQVNAVLPALLAGNSVILKPSPQTPLCGEHFANAYKAAGLPDGCLQVVHISPDQATSIVKDPRIQFVMFTGSVAVGRSIQKAGSESFKGVGLELGGKDPAYVRADADLDRTVPALVDATFFNSGQSCCSVERIYVSQAVYGSFVERFVERVKQFKLGDPSDPSTTLGPVVSHHSAISIRKQIADAVTAGAKSLIPATLFPISEDSNNYVAPQVLVDVDHSMSVMMDETFGPVVGIMKVNSDEEAVKLMNDSPYGLTASVWTNAKDSISAFNYIVEQLQTGTVYLNNADNLDPALAWSGWKDSGRGISLSRFGFDAFTRTKSVNIVV